MPIYQKQSSRELNFLGIETRKLWWNDSWQWFMTITLTAAILAKMAQFRSRRHTGDTKALVYLHQNWCHIRLECHLCCLVILRELKVPNSNVSHLEMYIYIALFRKLSFSILMHMPRIASVVKILFQSCCLMKICPLVTTLSPAWWCCCDDAVEMIHSLSLSLRYHIGNALAASPNPQPHDDIHYKD